MRRIITALVAVAASLMVGVWAPTQHPHSNSNVAMAAKARWNKAKDRQLSNFIVEWAPTMHQSYKKYNGQGQLHVSTGGNYPADLAREVTPDGGSIGWSPSGNGPYDYDVMAIYNYDGTEPPLPNRITYLFAFHHGKPVALVDQTRDGNPTCKPTANKDVAANFTRIANSHIH